MSLFPAYTKNDEPKHKNEGAKPWLDNSSFPVPNPSSDLRQGTPTESNSDSTSSYGTTTAKKKKRKNKKKKKQKAHDEPAMREESTNQEDFSEDRERDLTFLTFSKLPKSLRPSYDFSFKSLPSLGVLKFDVHKKKKKILRYFTEKKMLSGQDDESTGTELSKKVEVLNKAVHEQPSDIDNWLRLVNFQDEYFKFQPIQYKSIHERIQAANMKKLAILERAMAVNENNEKLQRTWLSLALTCCSFDEVETKVNSISHDSFIFTLGRILNLQQSMTRSNWPSVSKLYKESMEKYQRSRHLSSVTQDAYTLELLLHLCVYLQQSDLVQTMWKILKLSLSINLSMDLPDVVVPDSVVTEEENSYLRMVDICLSSAISRKLEYSLRLDFSRLACEEAGSPYQKLQLLSLRNPSSPTPSTAPPPLSVVSPCVVSLYPSCQLSDSNRSAVWTIWEVLENIRQGYHFLPVDASENFPQRVISSAEIMDFVYHIRSSSHFQLAAIALFVANVPFLPRSHSLFAVFASQMTPWLLNSSEQQLAVVYHSSPLLKINMSFLTEYIPYGIPPQYLKRKYGQEYYMEFVSRLFATIINSFEGRQRVAFGVWYLRFIRWLEKLAKFNRYGGVVGRSKPKSLMKEFLKEEKNRDVILFYVEYAIWESETEHERNAIRALDTLAESRGPTLNQADEAVKADLCFLYRTKCEVLIGAGCHDEAKLSLNKLCNSTNAITASKLKHIAIESMNVDINGSLEQLMLPNFEVNWIACYAYYLCLDGQGNEAEEFLNRCIESSASSVAREYFYEILVIIMKVFPRQRVNAVTPVVIRALNIFPVNSLFTLIMAESLVEGGGLWWKNSVHLTNSPITSGGILLACATHHREKYHEVQDTRLLGLLKQLLNGEGKTCALLHQMLLKVHKDANNLSRLFDAKSIALDSCPWNKCLIMDIISKSPNFFNDLTHLLVEKNLGIHITYDEVFAMKD